jgi:hypothetical protein
METHCVLCRVGTEALKIIKAHLNFKNAEGPNFMQNMLKRQSTLVCMHKKDAYCFRKSHDIVHKSCLYFHSPTKPELTRHLHFLSRRPQRRVLLWLSKEGPYTRLSPTSATLLREDTRPDPQDDSGQLHDPL